MSTNFNVNMPYVATINADGTLTIETIKAQSYQLTAADLEFNAYLLNGVFKSFMVSDEISGATALLNVDLNKGLSGEWVAEFIRNLQYAPSAPSDEGVAANAAPAPNAVFLQAWLEGIARSSLADELVSNGVAAALEASDLSPLEITNFAEDASAGAVNMWDGINGLTPQMRSLIATQVHNESYMDISHNAEVMQGLLPVRAGDSITFQFIVNQQYTVSEVKKNVGPAAGGMVGVGETAYNYDTKPLGTYGVGAKRINVIMKRLDGALYYDLCGAADSFNNEYVVPKETAYQTASGDYIAAVAAKATADASMNTFYTEWAALDASYNLAKASDDAAAAALAKYQELSGALIQATTNAAAAIGTPQYQELVHIKEKLEVDVSGAKAASIAAANTAGATNANSLKTDRDAKKDSYGTQVTAVTNATSMVRLRAGQLQAAKEALSVVSRRLEGLRLKRDAAKDTAQFNVDNALTIYGDASGAYYALENQRVLDISDAGVASGSKWALFSDASGAFYIAKANLAANPGDAGLANAYQAALEAANEALDAYKAARALAVTTRNATDTALTNAKDAETDLRRWQGARQIAQTATVFAGLSAPAAISLPAAPASVAL